METALTSFTPVVDLRGVAASRDAADEILIKRIMQQDASALKILMGRHQLRIYRFVLRLIRDTSMAEDVVRDTFFDVWRQADRFENRSSVPTWIMAIARNKALTMRERANLPSEALDGDEVANLADPNDGPETAMERKETASLMRRCLAALPAEQAMIMDLVYYHEKSIKEVATIASIPENTVKSRMFLARKKLATMLKRAGVNSSQTAGRRVA